MATNTELAEPFRVPSVESTRFALPRASYEHSEGLSGDFEKLRPAAKTRAPDASSDSSSDITRVLDAGAQLNALQQVLPSLPAVAAGVMGPINFCTLIQTPPSPPHIAIHHSMECDVLGGKDLRALRPESREGIRPVRVRCIAAYPGS